MTEEEKLRQEAVVEAVLFAMGKSIGAEQLAAALECSTEEAEQAAERLKSRLDAEKHGIQVLKFDGNYQLGTREEFYDALIRVVKAPKKQVLSPVVLETLSIIAYRQPVTKAEISRIRGVSSDHAVNRLIEYGLIYEAGRRDAPGRPMLFATTEEFLRRFGIDSTASLPGITPDEEAEIAGEVDRTVKTEMDETGEKRAENDGENQD